MEGEPDFMAYEQLVATWMSFMCTALKKNCGLSGNQFTVLAQKYRLISFLADNYELLHYYDNNYVIDDVKQYVKEQGGTLDGVS
jgi:predicted RNA-binding protein associated with RNAse of E/G family